MTAQQKLDNYYQFLEKKIMETPAYGFNIDPASLNPVLKEHQKKIALWSIEGGRRAIGASFGLGKTIIQLEIAKHVINHTGKSFLIGMPLGVVVARQDKAPLYFVQVEHGPVQVAVYDIDSECSIKIKQFMAAFGLVDIKMRMLRVNELLRIQGFPDGYQLAGNQSDQKKFIGNSVVPHVVKAWCEAMAARIVETNKKVA